MKIKFDIWRGNNLSGYDLTESELNDVMFDYLIEIGYISEDFKHEYEINISEVVI